MHRNRNKIPKTWPLAKKGTKYIPSFGNDYRMPAVIVIRDILNLAKNKKEVNMILKNNEVKVNFNRINDKKFPLSLYDVIELDKKYYRVVLKENKKFSLEEIKESEARKAVFKIVSKKIVKNGKIQANLSNGRNYLADKKDEEKIKVGSSALIDVEKKKIIDFFPMKKGAKVLVIDGKHIGKNGIIEEIDDKNKTAQINYKKQKINVLINYIMVEE